MWSSMPSSRSTIRRVHLIMAGAGETERDLRAQARPLGDRAHFVPTPTGDVADVLSAFDVSVFCPSPTEGAPRATILGMLAERPCLATGAEGVADLIRPEFGAIAQPENDPAPLAALLRGYLADPALGLRQGRAARAWAEQQYARPVGGRADRAAAVGTMSGHLRKPCVRRRSAALSAGESSSGGSAA